MKFEFALLPVIGVTLVESSVFRNGSLSLLQHSEKSYRGNVRSTIVHRQREKKEKERSGKEEKCEWDLIKIRSNDIYNVL